MDVEVFIKKLGNRKNLAEDEVLQILGEYNIPVPPHCLVKDKEELNQINIGYPIVLKVCSPEILHKTDVGGVKLDIKNKEEMYKAFNELHNKFPKEKVLVEKMEEPGIELIMGLVNDPTFGLTIMFGVGGIFTEVYDDVTFRVIPIREYDARQMLREIKGAKILEGFRGIKVNKEIIINMLLNLSRLAQDFKKHLDQMDLNPIFAREKDAVVVDAKMILR